MGLPSRAAGSAHSATAAAQLMDDFVSAQKSARAAETNPIAKAYRESLITQYKPGTWDGEAAKSRHAAGMLAFDVTLANTNDPDKAMAAAKERFEATAVTTAKPTGQPRADLPAFEAGRITGAEMRAIYFNEAKMAELAQARRKGEITPQQFTKIMSLINQE